MVSTIVWLLLLGVVSGSAGATATSDEDWLPRYPGVGRPLLFGIDQGDVIIVYRVAARGPAYQP